MEQGDDIMHDMRDNINIRELQADLIQDALSAVAYALIDECLPEVTWAAS